MAKCDLCLYKGNEKKCSKCGMLSNCVDNYPLFVPNTNYERIRNMSIEELVNFIMESADNDGTIWIDREWRTKEEVKQWLESGVENAT